MRNRPIVVLVCIYIVGLILVLVWQPKLGEKLFGWKEKEENQKEIYKDASCVEGLLLSVQKKKEEGRAKLRLEDGTECVLILTQEQEAKMKAGSKVRVQGEIWWPEPATNPGQWDGVLYARIHKIAFYMRVEDWNDLNADSNRWYAGMDRIRRWFSSQIDKRWNVEEEQILKAMLIGEKGELEEETSELFRRGGISHIMAISGLHLSILSQALERILKRFQRPKKVKLEVTAFLWGYVLLTGTSVSTLRAAIMMSVQTVATLAEREEDPPTTLALTAGILLIIQPLYLLDAGFCLSFGAILGMRYGGIVLMSVRVIPYRLRRILASSMGIQLVTLPLSLWFFSETSVYGFILNFWVVPAMGLVLVGSLASVGLSLLHPSLGQGLAFMVEALLFSFRKGSEWIAKLPGAQLRGKPQLYQMMLIGGIWILFYFYYAGKKGKRKRWLISVSGFIGALMLMYKPSNWCVMYLDVGQGDCAVIEWNQHVFIVDAGPQYEEVLKPYLFERGIQQIDGVLLSHGDWDHIEGLVALSMDPDFSIERLWVGESQALDNVNQIMLEENVEKKGGLVQRIAAGYRFETEGFSMEILSPEKGKEVADSNEDSLVALFEVENRSFFFPGDIGEKTEQKLLSGLVDVDVLKVAHHGSRYSTGRALLVKLQPEVAVISCGRENRYGHPHEETMERLTEQRIRWYTTAERGAVWIEDKQGQLECNQFFSVQ